MSKRNEAEERARRDALDRLPLPASSQDDRYPPIRAHDEALLMTGYSALSRQAVRIARSRLRRPETAIYDESGLLYGEPISEGRGHE